jgi:hypothetical protein
MSSSIQIRLFKGWKRHKTACLDKAIRRMKKYADKGRRPTELMVGDKVMLKLTPEEKK